MDNEKRNEQDVRQLLTLLVDKGLATEQETANFAEHLQRRSDRSEIACVDDLLINNGIVTERQLVRLRQTLHQTDTQPKYHIPDYRLQQKIGSGSMGEVYQAVHVKTGKQVAVKVLSERWLKNRQLIERFHEEGQAAIELDHPNLVKAIAIGEVGGYHYFIMEYVDGQTVEQILTQRNYEPYEEQEAIELIAQVGKALAYAHKMGIVHRDVKPMNIMVTKQGVVKLTDMGLACRMTDKMTMMKEAGRAFGTPHYISPEQIRGRQMADQRSDLYSLGATLYKMLTGRVPFYGQTPTDVMHMHMHMLAISVNYLNPALSEEIGQVVQVLMAKNPSHRYQTADELLADLKSLYERHMPEYAQHYEEKRLTKTFEATAIHVVDHPSEHAIWLHGWFWMLMLSMLLNVGLIIICLTR